MSLYGISTKILTVIANAYHQSPSVRYVVDSNRIRFIQSAKAPLCKVGDDLSICIWEGEGGGAAPGQVVRELEEEEEEEGEEKGEWQRQ